MLDFCAKFFILKYLLPECKLCNAFSIMSFLEKLRKINCGEFFCVKQPKVKSQFKLISKRNTSIAPVYLSCVTSTTTSAICGYYKELTYITKTSKDSIVLFYLVNIAVCIQKDLQFNEL